MGVLAAFAYSLIAFGPTVCLFIVTIARNPHEIITMILGSFFWLLALLVSSLVWIIVVPLRDVPAFTLPISVILQELFRWVYYRLIKKADNLLEIVSDDKSELRKHKIAYVGGVGFGLIAGIVMLANVLEVASGPGVVGLNGGNQFFVLTAALGGQVMIYLHICWGVLFFAGWERKNWLLVVAVPVSHMLVSCLSLINDYFSPIYFLAIAYCVCALLTGVSFFVAGARPKTLINFFKR